MHEAYAFTLSSLISMVKWDVIAAHFEKIFEYVNSKIENELKDSAIGVKYLIICL